MSHKAIRKALELAAHGIMVSDEGRSLFLDVADVRALLAERDALREALKHCAAVCAGETLSKSGLVRALELANSALAQEQGGSDAQD